MPMMDSPSNSSDINFRRSSDNVTTSNAPSSLSDALSNAPARRTNSPTSNAPKAILSCDFCRHRKTKCDKTEGGCSNCKRAGIKCNMPTRQRLPRGRNGGRTKVDAELKARVGRLENLVRTLGGNERLEDADALERALADTTVQERSCPDDASKTGEQSRKNSRTGSDYGRYLGGTFWANLSNEVTGLKEILDDESDQEVESEEQSQSTPSGDNSSSRTSNFSFILCTPDGMAVGPETMQHPPRIMRAGLCGIYLRAVDPMFKLIHRPSLATFLQDGQPYLDYPPNHPASEALSFAVYFAAVGSQTDEECRANFGESKAVLAGRYKLALEAALSRADLIVSSDLTTLTAFLLLIIFSRVLSNDRRPWTLLALALRIGQAQGIHREDIQPSTSVFWREMRRRVWNSLGVLDAQAASDRGTEPMIVPSDTIPYSTPAPLNINDADLKFDQQEELSNQDGITDCTIALVCRAADDAAIKLEFNAVPVSSRDSPLAYDWETRKAYALSWRKNMHEKFSHLCDPSQQLHQIIVQVIEIVALDLMLGAIRPLHKHPKADTPRVSGDYIIEAAAAALERAATMLNMPAFKDFLWFGKQYNQWHAIAVLAAELSVRTKGQSVDRAWAILDSSLPFYKMIIADSEKGMLWRPIEKLLKRAREKRAQALGNMPDPTREVDSSTCPTTSGFPPLHSSTSQQDVKASPPQTANAAMAFTPYLGPPPDGTSLGLSSAEMQAAQSGDWHLPPDFMKMDMNFESLDSINTDMRDSPDNAWQNWGTFTEGLQHDEAMFPMTTDNFSHAEVFGPPPLDWMRFGAGGGSAG